MGGWESGGYQKQSSRIDRKINFRCKQTFGNWIPVFQYCSGEISSTTCFFPELFYTSPRPILINFDPPTAAFNLISRIHTPNLTLAAILVPTLSQPGRILINVAQTGWEWRSERGLN